MPCFGDAPGELLDAPRLHAALLRRPDRCVRGVGLHEQLHEVRIAERAVGEALPQGLLPIHPAANEVVVDGIPLQKQPGDRQQQRRLRARPR